MHDNKPLPVPVVTVFLAAGDKIALFKRSSQVGTYAGAWAGLSGYVERLPLDQAYIELQEETGLGRDDVELRGIGAPVLVEDPGLDRVWAVFPFLFERYGPRKITIDWETDSIEWVAPDDIKNRRIVPGLDRALAAVWPTFGDQELWTGLADISVDTGRGATALAFAGLEVVEAFARRDPSASRQRQARALAACRPSMGVFPHLAARYLLDHPKEGELQRSIAESTAESAARAARALGSFRCIVTNSSSTAVREAVMLRHSTGAPFEVIIMESRPDLEGVDMARYLAREGVRVSVITDAQADLFTQTADAVLVGCDALTEDDKLQNKAGTSLLVMSAGSHGISCFAVTQTFKIVPAGFPHVMEQQEPDRVGKADGVRFHNFAFDTTPIDAFEAVFTENGPLTREMLESTRNRLGAAKLGT